MKKKNYVSLIVGCFVCAVACTLPATAQENARYPFHPSQEQPQPQTFDPQQAAERITNEMKTTLQLTDKQYKKIYKLNLKEQKRMYENKTENDRPPMNDWFGEGPGPKGMPPMEMEHRPMQPAQSSHTVDQESIRKEKAAK